MSLIERNRPDGRGRNVGPFAVLTIVLLILGTMVPGIELTRPAVTENGADLGVQTLPGSSSPEFGIRAIVQADTYFEVLSSSKAYYKDPYYIYGFLYEKGQSADVGAPNSPVHIYWGDGPVGKGNETYTDGEGYWELFEPVEKTPDEYSIFVEFRGQVIINQSEIFEYDPDNDTLDPDENVYCEWMRFPSNSTIEIEVFYHSHIEANISDTRIKAGEAFWLNGTVLVNETGEPIPQAVLNLTRNNNNVGIIRTSEEGGFNESLRFPNSTDPGAHTIRLECWQVVFEKNRDYGSSYTTFALHFTQKVKIDTDLSPFVGGQRAYVNGTATDLGGEPLYDPTNPDKIYGVKLTLKNDTGGCEYEPGAEYLLNGTFFEMNFTVPEGLCPGSAVLEIGFEGDAMYEKVVRSESVTIFTIPRIEIDDLSFEKPVINLTGELEDGGGRGISALLTVLINGTEVASSESGPEGAFAFPTALPEDVGVGEVNVTVIAGPTHKSLRAERTFRSDVFYSAIPRSDPELRESRVRTEYAAPHDGSGKLNITFEITNIGNVPSGNTSVEVSSSPSGKITIFLGGLDVGESIEKSFQWTPGEISSFDIIVDPDGVLKELNEENNRVTVELDHELYDLDGDGENNYIDEDTDGDGVPDDEEVEGGSDPYDKNSIPDRSLPLVSPPDEDNGAMGAVVWLLLIAVILVIAVFAAVYIRKRRK